MNEKTDQIRLESVIQCPLCGYRKQELMPTNACQWYYQCDGCRSMLRPLQGDCCVFCSYGSVACPPIQADGHGCSPTDSVSGTSPR